MKIATGGTIGLGKWRTYRRVRNLIAIAVLAMLACEFAAADVGSLVRDADACVAERKFDRAQALYARAFAAGAQFEADLPHARNLASAYLNSAPPNLNAAIPWLQVAVKLDPQSDSDRLRLAKALLRSGNLDAAIEQYRILAAAHPTSADYGIALASVLRQAGKSDEALQFLRSRTEKYPSLVALRIEYARQLNFNREYPHARRQFLAALAVEPRNLIAQVGLAKVISYEGDQQSAIAMYDRILRRYPGCYDAIVGKAFSLLWSGRIGEASVLLRQAAMRDPGDREVRQALLSLPRQAGEHTTVREERERSSRRGALDRSAESTISPEAQFASAPKPLRPPGEKPEQEGRQHVTTAGILGFCLMLASVAYGRSRNGNQGSAESAGHKKSVNPPPLAASADVLLGPGSPLPGEEETQCVPEAEDLPGVPPEPEPSDSGQHLELPVLALVGTPAGDIFEPEVYRQLHGVEAPAGTAGLRPPLGAFVEQKNGARLNVLLIGGRRHEVELESRWIPVASAEILWEHNWEAAIRRLATAPPDLIVLNTLTDDGATSRQMFDWIVANQAELRDRTIVICGNEDADGNWPEGADSYLMEPFGAPQWRQAVMSITHCPEFTSYSDLVNLPRERSYGELKTLSCSLPSLDLELDRVPPKGN